MPTLLQINVSANSGSHGKIVESIGRLALERGWRSIIAYGRAVNPSKNELIRIGSDWDIKEHVLESRLFDNHGLASRLATRNFIKQIKEIKPDIIHLHVIHGYYLNYKILFEYLNTIKTPVVWTFHDTWAYTGHCGHYGSINCEKWKTQCEACPLKWKDYPKAIIDCSRRNFMLKKQLFTSNNNLHIITVSQWLKKEVQQSFFKGKTIDVIQNGVDTDIFRPAAKNTNITCSEKKFRVLGVASQWGKLKGLEDFYQLREMLPSESFEITLVGLNERQINNLPDGIKGIKRTDSIYKLAELYSSADVFCNLTYADTFPTTNIESLACGTPVITYKTGGSPEILDKETGFVLEPGDLKTLVELLNTVSLWGDKKREEVSEKCRRRALDFYNAKSSFLQYVSLYDTIVGGKFVILGVSAVWGPVKGLDDYIKLSELLEDDERIVLVGVSQEQKKVLTDKIIGLPKTEEIKHLVQLYNIADVTLSLSKAETFGLTIAESLACGTPAIVYNQTALPYLIDDGTGFKVEVGDIKGLYRAIRQIKKEGKCYYSNNCRKRAEALFDLKKSYSDYINLYEELLNE